MALAEALRVLGVPSTRLSVGLANGPQGHPEV
jgi:hypothetical protein